MALCNSILIIEDDDGIREALRYALELEGYPVVTAENGKEGLRLLPRLNAPCLILLDLMMPVMNGWEFLEAMRAEPSVSNIPVAVVSAFSNKTHTIRAQAFLNKPIHLDKLFELVHEYCGSPKKKFHDLNAP